MNVMSVSKVGARQSLWSRTIDAAKWRWWYWKTQIAHGILSRCHVFPTVFSGAGDCISYCKILATLSRDKPPASVRIKELNGEAIFCRPATSDPWVLWDTFFHKFHLPASPIPAACCIVDLGANVGYTAAHFAARYKGARIVAVEMDEENARMAALNVKKFGSRCEVVRAAVWDSDGTVEYQGHAEQGYSAMKCNGSGGTAKKASPAICIESLFRQHNIETVDYLKMDIEGAEVVVFASDLSWTRRVKQMKIELHPPATFDSCSTVLGAAGFACSRDTQHSHCLIARRPARPVDDTGELR